MIQSPKRRSRDRLSAFFGAFELSVGIVAEDAGDGTANLVITGKNGVADRVVFWPRSRALSRMRERVLVAAAIDFGGRTNPLMNAMPDRVDIPLAQFPVVQAVTTAFVAEARGTRCGRQTALDRLCEVILLMVLRRAVDLGSAGPGLLAGLSHPELHRALVAMHDQPARAWRTEELAEISGMSRSRFMSLFPDIVGITPAAYLNRWRLTLGQRELLKGEQVKLVARRVGFGSATAFSRAFSRLFGHPPVAARNRTVPLPKRARA